MAQFNEFFTVMPEDTHQQILLDIGDVEISVIKCDWTSSPWYEASWCNKGKSNWANPVFMETLEDLFDYMNSLNRQEVIEKGEID
jgi:hypothetical protein